MDFLKFFQKAPAWFSLVVFGIVVAFVASRPSNFTFRNVPIGLDGLWRWAFTIIGFALVAVGLFLSLLSLGLFRSLTEGRKTEPEPLPVEGIHLDHVSPQTGNLYSVAGSVTPATKDVTVWLLRESLSTAAGRFTPSPYSATTLADGTWQASIHMWKGPFRIHPVVTTKETDDFYQWYHRALKAALDHLHEHDPNLKSVKNWPNLDSLPKVCHSTVSQRIDVP
jgi:hypothetical protein